MTTASWKQDIFAQLVERNRIQDYPFRDLIESYEIILQDDVEVREENLELQNELENYRKKERIWQEEISIFRANGVGASTTTSSYKVKELEERIFRLQEEIANQNRLRTEMAQTIMELSHDLKKTESALKATAEQLSHTIADRDRIIAEKEEVVAEGKKKDAAIDLMEQELNSIRKDFRSLEDRLLQVNVENKRLLEALLDQQAKEVDAMNEVHELHSQMARMKAELDGYRSGAIKDAVIQEGDDEIIGGNVTAPTQVGKILPNTHDLEVNTLQFSNNGMWFTTGSSDKTVKLWDAKNYACTNVMLGSVQGIMKVDISPSNSYVLGASTDGSVRIWGIASSRAKHTLTGHTSKVQAAAFSADSKKVITGSHDRSLKYWDMGRGACIRTSICQSSCLDLETRMEIVVSAHFDGVLRMWDPRTGNAVMEKHVHSEPISSVSLTSDSNRVLTNSKDNSLKLFDIRTLSEICTFRHPDYKSGVQWNKARISPNGMYVAAGSSDGAVFIWNTRTQKLESQIRGGHKDKSAICSVGWSPDGGMLASVGIDKQIAFYTTTS